MSNGGSEKLGRGSSEAHCSLDGFDGQTIPFQLSSTQVLFGVGVCNAFEGNDRNQSAIYPAETTGNERDKEQQRDRRRIVRNTNEQRGRTDRHSCREQQPNLTCRDSPIWSVTVAVKNSRDACFVARRFGTFVSLRRDDGALVFTYIVLAVVVTDLILSDLDRIACDARYRCGSSFSYRRRRR